MLTLKARNRWTAAGCIVLFLVVLIIGSFFAPMYGEICSKNEHTGHEECSHHHVTLIAFIYLGRALDAAGVVITAIFTGFIAWFTWTLRRSTDKLWEAGERTLIAAHRPWVEIIGVVAGPLIFDEQGARLSLSVNIKNVGNTPALNVVLATSVSLEFNLLEEQRMFCKQVKNWAGRSGPTMFPDRTESLGANLPISKADIEKNPLRPPGKTRPFIFPNLIGCIDYMRTPEGGHHQTRFIFSLQEIENGERFVIYPDRGNLQPEQLVLTRWMGGGFSAD